MHDFLDFVASCSLYFFPIAEKIIRISARDFGRNVSGALRPLKEGKCDRVIVTQHGIDFFLIEMIMGRPRPTKKVRG